jgi:hypothetical protein
MARKPRFPTEPDTRPDSRRSAARQSGPAPKDLRERSEAPTMPPPGSKPPTPTEAPTRPRHGAKASVSGVRTGKPDVAAATIDEVTADLSKDPRRENDENDERDEGGEE